MSDIAAAVQKGWLFRSGRARWGAGLFMLVASLRDAGLRQVCESDFSVVLLGNSY